MAKIPSQFLVFTTVSQLQVSEFLKATEVTVLRERLSDVFSLKGGDELNEVLIDFHMNNFTFTKKQRFTPAKMSCFLAVMDYVLHESLSLRLSNQASYDLFKGLLLKHSIERSPWSIAVFTLDEVKAMTDYVLVTFLRHYSMYLHIFNPHLELTIETKERFEGKFPPVLRIEEGQPVNPRDVPSLEDYLEPLPEEAKGEGDAQGQESEAEDYSLDPVQRMLNAELRALRKEMEEQMKKQDEEFLARIAGSKK